MSAGVGGFGFGGGALFNRLKDKTFYRKIKGLAADYKKSRRKTG